MSRCIFLILIFITPFHSSFAQSIQGQIIDLKDNKGIGNVNIENIHTGAVTTTDNEGKFQITALKGQLIECRKIGFKTLRLRLPQGQLPGYFRLAMQKGAIELPQFELKDHNRDYKKDSVTYYELYKNALEFPELTGLDMIQHPFSALSKRNRRIWAFQKEYAYFEQEKYIDYTFNEDLINNLTGLSGDSARIFIKQYRPTYEQLRSMNEYRFYSYVKQSVANFRSGRRYRQGNIRSSN